MEDSSEAAEADGWLSILIASSAPSIAQWADIVQNLLCHTNAAKGLFCFFYFQNGFWNELSFSKCGSFSKGVFIFKM